jgi:hypothetical protein
VEQLLLVRLAYQQQPLTITTSFLMDLVPFVVEEYLSVVICKDAA